MHQISETLNGLMREAAQEFPTEKAIALLTEMRQKILLCREKEETAFNKLKSIIE
ncbi:MAG: hypothetical protein MUP16_00300 [Sedimentisphaerales bacterium]|nr:hypothetical protein [Sedimentisphaerales bacterium]